MQIFTAPKSFRLASQAALLLDPNLSRNGINPASPASSQIYMMSGPSEGGNMLLHTDSNHPNFGHLTLLVLEAVLEVVCVSFPGYVLARRGLFNTEMQKFAANLNVFLFTPCLSKMVSSLLILPLADSGISLYKTGFAIEREHACGSCNYSSNLRYSGRDILRMLSCRGEDFWV